MKKCTSCNTEKEIKDFNKRRCNQCKLCEKKWKAEYYKKNKEKIAKSSKQYREKNITKLQKRRKKYYLDNKERIDEKNKIYEIQNKEKMKRYRKQYYLDNKKTICRKQKEYLQNNPEAKIKQNLRNRINLVLKGKIKSGSTIDLLGCKVEFFMQYLESKFSKGMTWDNHSRNGWHIDHIIPCANFDLTDPEQQKKCFHYSNLQPLWAVDNLRKSDKVPDSER